MRATTSWLMVLVTALAALAGCSDDGSGKAPVDDADFEDLGLQADESTGILRGVVIDEAIRPLQGVVVSLLRPGSANLTMETQQDGLFGFDGLEPGTYFIVAEKAGYIPVQGSGQVVAGEAEPPAVRLMLMADPAARPFVQPFHLDGYMTCSVRPMFIGAQCGFGGNDVVNSNEALANVPDWVQSEMTWDSTQAVGDELSLAIRCHPGDNDPAGKCADGVLTIVRAEGHSPLTAIINRTLAEAWGLGGEGGNPLIINLFAYGRSDLDVWNEETIDNAQRPVTGRPCMEWPNPAGLGPFGTGTCMRLTGPGLVLNQKIDVYTHVFFGYTPPEGWSFIETGVAPDPPA